MKGFPRSAFLILKKTFDYDFQYIPDKKTDELLRSVTKKSMVFFTNKLMEIHKKTLKFNMNKPNDIFCFATLSYLEDERMLGLTSLQLYKSIFNKAKENKNVKISVPRRILYLGRNEFS